MCFVLLVSCYLQAYNLLSKLLREKSGWGVLERQPDEKYVEWFDRINAEADKLDEARVAPAAGEYQPAPRIEGIWYVHAKQVDSFHRLIPGLDAILSGSSATGKWMETSDGRHGSIGQGAKLIGKRL